MSAGCLIRVVFWRFPKVKGTFLGGPHDKDYRVLMSILGSPYLGKLPVLPWLKGLF